MIRPAGEMPRLFERFHRVENAKGRTHEGSGIGLALVQELVKLHGGTVAAESVVGQGTAFAVTVPLGSAHLSADRIAAGRSLASTAMAVSPYLEEALRWLPDDGRADHPRPGLASALGVVAAPPRREEHDRPRVLVADDNADMRQHLARLLADHFRVQAVPDGEAALAAVRERPPELVLTDVMMPRLDGFGLLRALRADPRTRDVPVVLLSARAGEESRVEGVGAGADDYLVKPFSARELLARVSAQVQMARLRRAANESVRAGEERLRMALTAARMVAWEYDPAADKFTASDNLAEVYGLPPGSTIENTGQGFSLVHPDDADRRHAPFRLDYRLRRHDGQYRWAVDAGRPRFEDGEFRLLNNAAKYTDRGGTIRLSVVRQGGEVVVTVADTGVGIPAHMLPRVFDMFAQVDRSLEKSQGGLGIGLNTETTK